MTSPLQPAPLILAAIEQTRMLRLIYHNKERVIEPHDHGILMAHSSWSGIRSPGSSSRSLPNWLLMKTEEIIDLELLDRTFPGGRPTASGSHIKWEKLFIRVKPVGERTQTGAT
jgi:hypothetical protein